MLRYLYSNSSYYVKGSPLEELSTDGTGNDWFNKEAERAFRTYVGQNNGREVTDKGFVKSC